LTLATKLAKSGTAISIIGSLFILWIEYSALNDDCNPCGYYLSLWIFYPLVLGLGMVAIGFAMRRILDNPTRVR
jgi:hypothetical protein